VAAERARDLVRSRLEASGPNQLWVAEHTYLRTYTRSAYPAFIVDVYSWMLDVWRVAAYTRGREAPARRLRDGRRAAPAPPGLIAHSDKTFTLAPALTAAWVIRQPACVSVPTILERRDRRVTLPWAWPRR
jgi:hypothetical protein